MKRRHLLLLPAAAGAGVALGAAGLARAQATADPDPFARPPAPGAPLPPAWPAVAPFTLANGLQVVVAERRRVPLVTAAVVLRAGRETDPAGQAGQAALAATLLTRGARRRGKAEGAVQIARDAESLGGTLDAQTAWRHASLATTVTPPRLDAALALLADCVARPLLATAEFERARAQAQDALRVDFANPADVALMAARRAFWGDTPPGRSPTAATLAALKAEALRAHHARFVRPDRAWLVLAGEIDADSARALAERHFGGWARPGAEAPALPAPRPQPVEAGGVLVEMPGSGQSGVVVAAPFVAGAAEDRAVADLASAVLGGGYSSRLNQEVRIQRGLSYGVGAFGEPQAAAGAWFASAQTQHATAGTVLALMRGELKRLAQAAPAAAELEARRATVVGGLLRRLETTQGLATWVTGQLAAGRSPAALAAQVQTLMAVTPEQVRAFAERQWAVSALRYAVAGDLAAGGAALGEAAPGALRRTASQLDFGAGF